MFPCLSIFSNLYLLLLFSGFLKGRKKKERSKKGKGKEDGEAEGKDIGSDGEERGRSETPTPDQVRKGIRIRDEQPGSYFHFHFLVLICLHFWCGSWILDPGWKNSDPGSEMRKIRIRDADDKPELFWLVIWKLMLIRIQCCGSGFYLSPWRGFWFWFLFDADPDF